MGPYYTVQVGGIFGVLILTEALMSWPMILMWFWVAGVDKSDVAMVLKSSYLCRYSFFFSFAFGDGW